MKKLLFLLLLVPAMGMAQINPGGDYYVETVNNHNIRTMAEMIDRGLYEIYNSESSRVESIKPADLDRIYELIDALQKTRDAVVNSADTDYVHSHPMDWPVTYVTDSITQPMFNIALRDVIVKLALTSIELTASHSALLAADLQAPDLARFDRNMADLRQWLDTYVKVAYPKDTPEVTRAFGGTPATN